MRLSRKVMCDRYIKVHNKVMKTLCTPCVRETVIRERRKHASRSPVPTALAVRAVKTKLQETQALRIAGCFSCWLLTLKKVCQLCKQEMLSNAGHAECDNNRVVSSHHILAEKIYYVTGKVQRC